MSKSKYVILCIDHVTKKEKFLSYNSMNGGFPCWNYNISKAKIFKTKAAAIKRLDNSDFSKKLKMKDGTLYPPTMIQEAIKTYENKTTATKISILVCQLKVGPIEYYKQFDGLGNWFK